MESSNNGNASQSQEPNVERQWTNLNRDSLKSVLSDRIDRAVENERISGKITTDEAEKLHGLYAELLGEAIDGALTGSPEKFNHQLTQQEQTEIVKELMGEVTSRARERILQRRS
jgi:hypothetical protein